MKDTAVLLVAAGLSSRMGRFKPLMLLDDMPLIAHTLSSFRSTKISHFVIVTGYHAKELEAALSDRRDIVWIHNEKYADTEMFDSIKLGLHRLQNHCQRLFVMPSDIPLVQPFTIEMLSAAASLAPIVQPAYHGKHGHPLRIDAACIPRILHHTGGEGLRGALSPFNKHYIEMPDPAVTMDIDTPDDFLKIEALWHEMRIPTREMAMAMLSWHAESQRIIQHSLAVEALAVGIAQHAVRQGFTLNQRLVESGALLHDIMRKTGSDHASAAEARMRRLGYPLIARIVSAHMDLPPDALQQPDERAVVYLADKLILDDKRVGLSRFTKAFEKYADVPEAASAIRRRYNDAVVLLQRFGLSEQACLTL